MSLVHVCDRGVSVNDKLRPPDGGGGVVGGEGGGWFQSKTAKHTQCFRQDGKTEQFPTDWRNIRHPGKFVPFPSPCGILLKWVLGSFSSGKWSASILQQSHHVSITANLLFNWACLAWSWKIQKLFVWDSLYLRAPIAMSVISVLTYVMYL